MRWSLLVLALASVPARASLPVGLDGEVVGPGGVAPVVLADLPELSVELLPGSGHLRLRDARTGTRVEDGDWPPDQVTPFPGPEETRLVRADAEGRVTRVTWGSGRRCVVERDDSGRVVAVYGPGPGRKRLTYDGGLTIEDTLGTVWSATSEDGRTWVVRDGAGRQVRLSTDDTGRLRSWEDPRGVQSVVQVREDVTEVVGPAGAVWRVGRADGGGFLEQPNGLRWTWQHDTKGRLARVTDPGGLDARWAYDSAGRLVSAEVGGRRTGVERDIEGRVTAVTDPSGATVRLRWEGDHVDQIIDASGAAVVLERDKNGAVEAILTRSGGRWELDRDLDGKLEHAVDPVGRELALDRDGAGRVGRATYQGQTVRLERDSAGRVVGVVDPRGLRTGLVREATGRVREVRSPGRSLHIERDSAGEVVGVRQGALEVLVHRDAAGRPVSAGPVAWTRDLMGVVDKLIAPGIAFLFGHDTVGRLTSVRAPGHTIELRRNPYGEAVAWTGGAADVRAERDSVGRVMVEQVGDRVMRATHGIRGGVDRVDGTRGTWRWSRGTDAAVLRAEGPDGVGVGTDRDAAGRVTLARLPGGGLLRRAFEDGVVMEQLDNGSGGMVSRTMWSPDMDGHVAWVEVEGEARRVWQTGADGGLAGIDAPDDPAASWQFSGEVDRGPGGWVRASDLLGRTTELMVGDAWPAWGAVGGAWAYERSASGALMRVTGADGAFEVAHDPFGRLVAVRNGATLWGVEWDAVGRPHRLLRPSGVHDIVWAPGQVRGTPLATGRGGEVAWVDSETGALAWSRARMGTTTASAGAVSLPGGLGLWVEDALGLIPIRHGLRTGVADSATFDPIGGRGGLLMFTGGPELFVGGALDPAAPERTDGTLDWPWTVDDGVPRVVRSVWDPAGWDPEGPWGDPLTIADRMGLVDLPDRGTPEEVSRALPWLPGALEGQPQPIGPPRGQVSLTDELPPLEARLVAHLTRGEGPIPWSVVVGDLVPPDAVGTLPPGVFVSGLGGAGGAASDVAGAELSKKVVAGWEGLL